jgi:hypothetical protein
MESANLFDQYDYAKTVWGPHFGPYAEPKNLLVDGNRVSAYVCPCDPQDQLLDIDPRENAGRVLWWKTNAGGVTDSLMRSIRRTIAFDSPALSFQDSRATLSGHICTADLAAVPSGSRGG